MKAAALWRQVKPSTDKFEELTCNSYQCSFANVKRTSEGVWEGSLTGPQGTPYHNGVYSIKIIMRDETTRKPKFTFSKESIPYCCNVNDETGDIIMEPFTHRYAFHSRYTIKEYVKGIYVHCFYRGGYECWIQNAKTMIMAENIEEFCQNAAKVNIKYVNLSNDSNKDKDKNGNMNDEKKNSNDKDASVDSVCATEFYHFPQITIETYNSRKEMLKKIFVDLYQIPILLFENVFIKYYGNSECHCGIDFQLFDAPPSRFDVDKEKIESYYQKKYGLDPDIKKNRYHLYAKVFQENDTKYVLNCSFDMTFGEMKQLIRAQIGISPQTFRLIYAGRVLQEEDSHASTLQTESTLLIQKLD